MVLLDSNIIIYGVQQGYQSLRDYLASQSLAISKVTLLEVLGYHALGEEEKSKLEEILNKCHQISIDDTIIYQAIALRQQKKMSLGDALIAATALHHQLLLVTANDKDYNWITDLQLYNPVH